MAQKSKETTRRPKAPLATLGGDPLGVALESRQRCFGAPGRFLWLLGTLNRVLLRNYHEFLCFRFLWRVFWAASEPVAWLQLDNGCSMGQSDGDDLVRLIMKVIMLMSQDDVHDS